MLKPGYRLAFLAFLVIFSCFNLQAGSAHSQIRTGIYRGRPITYSVRGGKAVYEGDILLEHVDPIRRAQNPGRPGGPPSVTTAYSQYLWPKVNGVATVFYIIDPLSDPNAAPKINAAIGQFNSDFAGVIKWTLRTNQTVYVDINLNANDHSGQCEAEEGYQPNFQQPQPMGGSTDCTLATILHEMGHVVGLWHEQTRSDRDTYVSVNYNNIIKASRFNFDIIQDNVQNLTPYDYSSLMQYPPFVQTRTGGPSIETIPAGMPLSGEGSPTAPTDYSAADKEGVLRLYGVPPTAITVTTNPPGLQVLVDGSPVTTPQVFNWALNSVHTLDVPANVQTQAGVIANSNTPTTFFYTYGRWNDSPLQSHIVTVTPGNGEVPFPATSPQIATYTANFIQLVPYTPAVFPANSGTLTPSPQPQSYPGVSGLYFVAREQATLTAAPSNGWNFYEINNAPFWLAGGLSENPKTFYVPDTGLGVNPTAEFSNTPVYTVDVTPETFSSNLYAWVDGGFWLVPKNFSSFYDSTWTAGSQHTLNIDSPEFPYSFNSRYAFLSWSDGGAQSHTISSLPATSTSYIATVTPEFQPADNWSFGLPCGSAAATITPTSGDGFYPIGQILTFDQTPASGWTFAGWSYDLTGLTSPQNLTANDETLVFANYNTVNTPLSMTGLTPPTAAAGGAGLTLVITGTGFTSTTQVWVNNTFRNNSTFVNSTTLNVPLTAADLAAPAALQIFVQNFPSGSNCSVSAAMPFFVYQGAPAPIVTATPASLTFKAQAAGTTSASQSVVLKNTGTAAATLSIAASGEFGQTNNCSSTLNPGASCTVKATFAPRTATAIDGAITVADNAANSPQVVSLTGKGLAPVSLTPLTLAFGNQAVGVTSAAQNVTLTNNLKTTLTFTFSASANYATGAGTTCGTTLPAGKKCLLAVTFTPTANGIVNGALAISYSGAFSPAIVALGGTGTGGATAPLTFTPATLTFGKQATGTTSAAKKVTVKNISASSVTLGALSASADYSVTGTGTTPCSSGFVLKAAHTCTVNVTFTPAVGGIIKGGIAVADSSAVSPQVLDVSGTAAAPVTFTPSSLIFPAQTVGTTSALQTVTLANNLSTTLTGLTLATSGDFTAAPGGTTPCSSTVVAKGTCTFTVTFTPSQTGVIQGGVTVSDSASNSPQVVNLSGTGQ